MSDLSPETVQALIARGNQIASFVGCCGQFEVICIESGSSPSEWCAYCVLGRLAALVAASGLRGPQDEEQKNDLSRVDSPSPMVVLCLDTESDLATEAGAAKRAAEAALSAATVAAQQIRELAETWKERAPEDWSRKHVLEECAAAVLALLPPEGQ